MVLVGRKKGSKDEGMHLQLGKYEIGRTLGEGNFGKVKYAKDVQTGHSFAVKILEKTRIKNLNFSDQCLKPKRERDATWFSEKVLLVEAQGNGKVHTKEELEFLADPGIAEAKAVLMANLSSYGSDVLSEIRPMLYNGNVIAKETNVISIANFEETLMLEEEIRSKMLLKQSDPMVLEKKVNIKPVNYAALNQLSKDFGKRFVPQTKLSTE
ncbi:retrovirus-related pol polyprotein from transposon TNT 1-94 [Tanacetum coccineum]